MAAQVKLVRRGDFSGDISSLSLFNYEQGFSLVRDGWVQAAAGGDARVPEAMTLHVKGSSHDDLAAKLQLLDDKMREVGWHGDAAERYGVWLRAQMPDESEARQALVTGMRGEPGVSFYAPPAAPGGWLQAGYNLALERTPWWEATSLYMHIATSLNCHGAMKSYGNVYGDVPSRIAKTVISGAPGGDVHGDVHEFWLGFRTDRFGNRANFKPVWDLGQPVNGGVGYNDTDTQIDDDTAYGLYRAECTFTTDETELNRLQISLQNATTDYEDQRGSYIVLLRAKVGAGTTCHVRLKDGFLYTSAIRSQQRVEVTATSWFLHALGTVNIPPSHGILSANFLRQYGFEIHASRTSGSGYLCLDCLILIPCAEGSLHVTGAAVKYWLGDTRPSTIVMTADGKMAGWSYMDNLPRAALTVEPDKYALPVGAGSIVLAGQRETEHTLTDYVTVMLSSYNRYRTLRGTQP